MGSRPVALLSACLSACDRRAATRHDMPPLLDELADFEFPAVEKLDQTLRGQNHPVVSVSPWWAYAVGAELNRPVSRHGLGQAAAGPLESSAVSREVPPGADT